MVQHRSVWLDRKTSDLVDEYVSDRKIMGRKVSIASVVRKALTEYTSNHRADPDMIQKLQLQQLEDEEYLTTRGHKRITAFDSMAIRGHSKEEWKEHEEEFDKKIRSYNFKREEDE